LAKRVHNLAKELGVKSTAIVAKCQAEGLDVKNHMSTLSAGLEATIREWFSEEVVSTSVETTARVDLDKVKAKKPRARKKKTTVEEGGETTVAVAEAPVETVESPEATAEQAEAVEKAEPKVRSRKDKAVKSSKPRRKSPQELAAVGEDAPSESGVKGPESGEEQAQEAESETKATEVKPPKPRKLKIKPPPPPPKPVIHVPKPATLQGPKVVRMERPDIIKPPPPREPRKRGKGGEIAAVQLETPQIDATGRGGTTSRKGRRRGLVLDDENKLREREINRKSKVKKLRGGRGYEAGVIAGPHEWGDRDLQEREQRLAQASGSKLIGRARRLALEEESAVKPHMKPQRIEKAVIKEPITMKDLSAVIGVRVNEIISNLMQMGVMAGINDAIDVDAATMVAMEFGVELTVEAKMLLLDKLQQEYDETEEGADTQPRPPVVAFLGHVDHGKTSLLDRIRKTSVTSGEAGGITQHIGSYLYDDGKRRVAFLDTPGHKAFTAMRARGATMTDIVVLVVAADDGVMPQTVEAISHARAAEVPIVVALNKIDLPNIDENRVFGELAEQELVPTEWGGEVEVVRTSATTGEGIEDLIEHLDYVAELRHLKARAGGSATGWVVEAEMAIGKGVMVRLLVKSGILKPGDAIVSGSSYGRIRTIEDAYRKSVKEAGPATPVEVTGLDTVPKAGDRFFVVDNIARAAEIADEQRSMQREKVLAKGKQITLENLYSEIAAGELRELNVIIKADVQGSVDVLRQAITEMNTAEVAVRILHSAVGGISESDVLLAEASNAIIIGFHVVADDHARDLAETRKVEIRLYRVIYDISEDIRQALEGMLAPRIEEKQLGRVEVRRIFKISRIGTIAGCYVTEGVIQRSARVRLIRDSIVLRDNMNIESLRREKNDVSDSRAGFECGIKLAGFDDLKEGDIIEAYEMVEISRLLELQPEQSV
jgi:translation initiation factor IF-2